MSRGEEVKGPMYYEIVYASGGYRVHMRGGNHEKVFTSEVFVSKSGAYNAIGLVQSGAATAPVYDRT
jgi:uncharacterized protein YegP (UPF0339 family)